MQLEKFMDMRRWFCMARPQILRACGMTSLVSCWNFLHSTLGVGHLQPISVEEGLETAGILPPYENVPFGSFSGNATLIRWYSQLNDRFGAKGDACLLYKKFGGNATKGMTRKKALKRLKEGLRSPDHAYVYHCFNHYMCPVGYESTSQDDWIIIGDISAKSPVFHVRRWEEIAEDIECEYPKFVDIREEEFKIQQKTAKQLEE